MMKCDEGVLIGFYLIAVWQPQHGRGSQSDLSERGPHYRLVARLHLGV